MCLVRKNRRNPQCLVAFAMKNPVVHKKISLLDFQYLSDIFEIQVRSFGIIAEPPTETQKTKSSRKKTPSHTVTKDG